MSIKNLKQSTTLGKMLDHAAEPKQPIKTNSIKKDVEEQAKEKEDKKYLRLDITEQQDYISLMSEHQKVSMTKYIQRLIDKDLLENKETFNKLKQIKEMMNNI